MNGAYTDADLAQVCDIDPVAIYMGLHRPNLAELFAREVVAGICIALGFTLEEN